MERFYLQWHITNLCNNGCLHCYLDQEHGQTDIARAADIVADICSVSSVLGVQSVVNLTGGDPLLHPDFWEILELVRQECDLVGIMGNPELLSADVIQRLRHMNIDWYQLSLDGMKNIHDHFRYPGSFELTLQKIRAMSDQGIDVGVMSTVSPLNIGELLQVANISYEAGARGWSYARYVSRNKKDWVDPGQYADFIREAMSVQSGLDHFDRIKYNRDLCMSGLVVPDLEPAVIKGGCGLGSSVMALLPDNTLMGCRRLPESNLGRWSKEGDLLNKFLFHPLMEKYREIASISGCGQCDFLYQCRGCRAVAYAAGHGSMGEDPGCQNLNQRSES